MNIDIKSVKQFGLLLLITWGAFGVLRFFLIQPNYVHYHADFAVYINDEKQEFDSFAFYEDVTSCTTKGADATPESRVHMHDNVSSIVHVHDELVTWSHFFSALDWGLTDRNLTTWSETFDEQAGELTFVLNDEVTETLANKVIDNEDRVLINFGDTSEQDLQNRYEQIGSQAAKFNAEKDPAACSGEDFDTATRLKNAFLFTN